MVPHDVRDGSVNWNCDISSSLVFERLWFPVVYWIGL